MFKKVLVKFNNLKRNIHKEYNINNLFWGNILFIRVLIYKIYEKIKYKLIGIYDMMPVNPIDTGIEIKKYNHLFRTVYSEQENEWLEFLNPVLKELMKKKGVVKILEIGCGIGYLLTQLSDMGFKASGIDFSKNAVEHCKNKKLDVICGNSKDLPWKSNYFDFVCSMGALEHYTYDVFDLLETFKEAHRVLRPDGIFAFFVPCFENSNKWNAIYKSGYLRNADQYELGWSSKMWMRVVGNLFDWEIETFEKIKYKSMHKHYIYIYITCRKK